jgi:hypothetical protein
MNALVRQLRVRRPEVGHALTCLLEEARVRLGHGRSAGRAERGDRAARGVRWEADWRR